MAIYYCKTNHVQRSTGRSAVAAAAYRSADKLTDVNGKISDYTRKQGVLHTAIITPKNLDIERNELWRLAELSETRSNARTAREIVIALPEELDKNEQIALATAYAQSLVERYEIAADLAIHEASEQGDDRNTHAHILMTTRKIERAADNTITLTKKSDLELSDRDLKKNNLPLGREQVEQLRLNWEKLANAALAAKNIEARIDRRSYERQGIDKLAQQHEGVVNTQMRRRNVDTAVTLYNDYTKEYNALSEQERKDLSNVESSIQDLIKLENEIIASERLIAKLQFEHMRENASKTRTSGLENVSGRVVHQQQEKTHMRENRLSLDDKKNALSAFNAKIKFLAEQIHQNELKTMSSTLDEYKAMSKKLLEQIEVHKNNKPLNPFKTKAWQQELNALVKHDDEIKSRHAKLKNDFELVQNRGVAYEHYEKAHQHMRQKYPDSYQKMIELQREIKEQDTAIRSNRTQEKNLER